MLAAIIAGPSCRVLRLDSLSKFMAPGMRIGWLTAPEEFVSKYQLLQEISSQVSGLCTVNSAQYIAPHHCHTLLC